MSYINIMNKMKQNITDGSEYCKMDGDLKKLMDSKAFIAHTNCEYCNQEILAVWDEYNSNNYWPYLGVQAKKPNVYKYSPIIQAMRKHDDAEGKVWNNHLLNVHARVHSEPTNWAKRASKESIRLLCNSCFQKTYNRIKVQGDDGILYALSVVKDRNETVESVMKDLGITGVVIGKGAISEY